MNKSTNNRGYGGITASQFSDNKYKRFSYSAKELSYSQKFSRDKTFAQNFISNDNFVKI